MCLAILAIDVLPDWPLIVVANRDEYHDRAAVPLQPWHHHPNVLAGQDLQAGGTWLGVTSSGRFSLLTNYRNPRQHRPQAPSRGRLVENFLKADLPTDEYLSIVEPKADEYNGFNLIVADGANLHYSGNQAKPFKQLLTTGVYGLSNALLDTPWPKTERTREAVAALLAETSAPNAEQLTALMRDRTA
ncbi:MAG: NRDE family protein, partial [Orrella sp.]